MLNVWLSNPVTGDRYDVQADAISWAVLDQIGAAEQFSLALDAASIAGGIAATSIADGTPIGVHSLRPDGTPLVTGYVTTAKRTRTSDETSNVDTITLGGFGDRGRLAWRVTWPDPTIPAPWATTHYTAQGSTVPARLLDVINTQCGPGAIPTRRIPRLTVAAPPASATAAVRPFVTRLETVLEAVTRYGASWGTVDVVDIDGTLQVSARPFVDLSRDIILSSDTGTLPDLEQTWELAPASIVLAAGPGEGTDRTFAEATATTTIWGGLRREHLLDQRNTPAEDLATEAAAWLEDNPTTHGVVLADVELGTFSTDPRPGDWVTVQLDGLDLIRQVTSIESTTNVDGRTTIVALGGALLEGEAIWKALANHSRRINQQERT